MMVPLIALILYNAKWKMGDGLSQGSWIAGLLKVINFRKKNSFSSFPFHIIDYDATRRKD